MKAMWKDKILAESDETRVIESNHYFPPNSLKREFFKSSDSHSTCPWKGEASYFDIEVDGETNPDAAWYYKEPSEAAREIKGYIAFWKGVKIID